MRATFVSTDTIVFKSLPCAGNCSFGAPLLFRFALNGVDFKETQKTFRFLENTTMTRLSPRVGATTGGTSVEIEATNMNAREAIWSLFGSGMAGPPTGVDDHDGLSNPSDPSGGLGPGFVSGSHGYGFLDRADLRLRD